MKTVIIDRKPSPYYQTVSHNVLSTWLCLDKPYFIRVDEADITTTKTDRVRKIEVKDYATNNTTVYLFNNDGSLRATYPTKPLMLSIADNLYYSFDEPDDAIDLTQLTPEYVSKARSLKDLALSLYKEDVEENHDNMFNCGRTVYFYVKSAETYKPLAYIDIEVNLEFDLHELPIDDLDDVY